MLKKLFGKSMVTQSLTIVAVVVLLWLPKLLHPTAPTVDAESGILYRLIGGWLSGSPIAATAIAAIAVTVEGLLLNLMLANAGLVRQTTLLPTLLFVAAASAGTTTLTPMVIVVGVMIAYVSQLMLRGTLLTISTEKISTTTALIGVATMVYVPSVTFLLSYLLAVVTFRLYNWRDWAALLLGFAAPYVPLMAVLFWTGQTAEWWGQTVEALSDLRPHIESHTTVQLIGGVVMAVIAVVSIGMLASTMGERPVMWQTNATTVMLTAVGGVALICVSRVMPTEMMSLAIPFALCGTHIMQPEKAEGVGGKTKRSWMREVLMVATIVAAMIC